MGFIIFSVDRYDLRDDQNLVSREWVEELLTQLDITNKQLEGFYEGRTEKSYLIPERYESWVKSVCNITKQDCYLKVDDNKNTEVVNKWGDCISVGLWQQVAGSVAESLKGYTKFRGNFYVASKTLYPRPAYKNFL